LNPAPIPPMPAPSQPSTALRILVAATPVVGALLFPLLVAVLMAKVGIGAGVLAAVLIGVFWFVAMLRTAEMPGHS
jgi:hypothetical protein